MTLKIVEDHEKIWALGVPVNKAKKIAPELEWKRVFIRVIDPPKELLVKFINTEPSYVFSEIPILKGIESSWHYKKDEEEPEYVEMSPEQLQQFMTKVVEEDEET